MKTNLYKDNENSHTFWDIHQKIIQRQLFQLKEKVIGLNVLITILKTSMKMLIKNINILTRLIINGNVKKTSRTLDLYSHGSNTSVCKCI